MNDILLNNKLKKSFYQRELLKVARDLLGKILVKIERGKTLAGKIVELEAYHGDYDQAAHSYGGMTNRNKIMFEKGGYFYVYFTYGAHHCCNVVTGKKGQGTAVLIRAVEPVSGIDLLIKNRFGRKLRHGRLYPRPARGRPPVRRGAHRHRAAGGAVHWPLTRIRALGQPADRGAPFLETAVARPTPHRGATRQPLHRCGPGCRR